MNTLRGWLCSTEQELSDLDNPRLNAEIIISTVLKIERLAIPLSYDRILTEKELAAAEKIVRQRKQHIPLQYIFKEVNFLGYDFVLNKSVLIPRPETELLVVTAIKYIKELNKSHLNILDIGTGSGIIAVSLKKMLTDNRIASSIDAVDIDEEVLKLANENAKRLAADVNIFYSDIYSMVEKRYELIVSNPPYISSSEYDCLQREVKEYEPRKALLAGEDGLLYYRRIISKDYLTKEGLMFLEIGAEQGNEIIKLAEENRLTVREIIKDFNDRDRIAVLKN